MQQRLILKEVHKHGHCLTCHEGGHRAHLRRGDCKLAPSVGSPTPQVPTSFHSLDAEHSGQASQSADGPINTDLGHQPLPDRQPNTDLHDQLPPDEQTSAWKQVLDKLEAMHRDMHHYAGRVSDLEGQILAVREEAAQLRQQIPAIAELQDSVSNLAARLLTLELAQKQWDDDNGADWYKQQHDETLEQGLEQVIGNSTAQFAMSDGGSTPRDNNSVNCGGRPSPTSPSVSQLLSAGSDGTHGLGPSLPSGLPATGGFGLPGAVPPASTDLRRLLDLQTLQQLVPQQLRPSHPGIGVDGAHRANPTQAQHPQSPPGLPPRQTEPLIGGGARGGQSEGARLPPSFGQASTAALPTGIRTPGGALSQRANLSSQQEAMSWSPNFGVDPTVRLVAPLSGPHIEGIGAGGLQGTSAEDDISSTELNLLYKVLSGLKELPTIGSDGSRAERLATWRATVGMQLQATRPVVEEWWTYVNQTADQFYKNG